MRALMRIILMFISLMFVADTSLAVSWQWLTPQRVHSMVKEGSGLWLVDVRIPAAFEQGHIEGAVNIPSEQLNVKNLPKSKAIVLVDDALGLHHARAAADILLKKGYDKVFIMDGGILSWEREKLPIAGIRSEILRPVPWEDLAWAQSASIPHKLYDLRDDTEKVKGPVQGAVTLKGKTLEERLKTLVADLTPFQKKGLASKLEKPVPIVLVAPNSQKSLDAIRTAVKGVQGDIRYLEGAYPLWVAREKQNPLPGPEVCPTCPSGKKVTK
jgi:rhodanese-related sulfurtransferase